MEHVIGWLLGSVLQAPALLMESRQLIGVLAAAAAAMLAAQLGWHGTDRIIAWRGRADQD